MMLKGEKSDSVNQLLWTPQTPNDWFHMANEGQYFLERYERANNGITKPIGEYIQSKQIVPIENKLVPDKFFNISYTDFEYGTGSWVTKNTAAIRETNSSAYEGLSSVRLNNSAILEHGLFNLQGYKSIEISLFVYGGNTEGDDSLHIEFFDGASWIRKESFTGINSANNYSIIYSFLIPKLISNQNALRLVSTAGSSERFNVDAISVKASNLENVFETVSNIYKGRPTNLLFVDSLLMAASLPDRDSVIFLTDQNVSSIPISYADFELDASQWVMNNQAAIVTTTRSYSGTKSVSLKRENTIELSVNSLNINKFACSFIVKSYSSNQWATVFYIDYYNGTSWITANTGLSVPTSSNNYQLVDIVFIKPNTTSNFNKIRIRYSSNNSIAEMAIDEVTIVGNTTKGVNQKYSNVITSANIGDQRLTGLINTATNGYLSTNISYSGFETPSGFENWSRSGTVVQKDSTFQYSGSKSVRIGQQYGYINHAFFDASPYSTLEISLFTYSQFVTSADSIQVSFYDGSTWSTIYTFGGLTNNNYNHFKFSILVPTLINNRNSIRIRVKDRSFSSSRVYVDDIFVSGELAINTSFAKQNITKGQLPVITNKVLSKTIRVLRNNIERRILHSDFETSLENWSIINATRNNTAARTFSNIFSIGLSINGVLTSPPFYQYGFSHYRVSSFVYLSGIEANDVFKMQYFDGTNWVDLENVSFQTFGQDNAFYKLETTISANRHNITPNLAIRFVSAANLSGEIYQVDAVTITGLMEDNPNLVVLPVAKLSQPADVSYFYLQHKFSKSASGAAPLTEKQQLIYDLIYTNAEETTVSANPSLAEMYTKQQVLESKYFVVLKLIEQDPICAQVAKMGYVDQNINQTSDYDYRIFWTDGADTTYSDFLFVSGTEQNEVWEEDFFTEGKPGKIDVNWTVDIEEGSFSYYNIYRKKSGTSDTTFLKLNAEPFVYMTSQSSRYQQAGWTDTTTYTNGILDLSNFVYKIEGVGFYGKSVFSPLDTAHAHPVLPAERMTIDTLTYGNGHATLFWKIPANVKTYLQDILVYQIIDENEAPVLFKTLSKDSIKVTIPYDYRPINYLVEARLISDYGTYSPLPTFVQFPDSIAPAMPSAPFGIISSEGNVELHWPQNTEVDLYGYNLYYSNEGQDSATYTRINNVPILDTNYYTSVDPDLKNDMIFYKIAALDYRQNESPLSVYAMLDRPDNVNYIATITNLNPTKDGIRIAWEESDSTKVDYYLLQRRPASVLSWDSVLVWQPAQLGKLGLIAEERVPPRFIDTTTLEFIPHLYRIIAVSKKGVKSYSEERQVEPYDDGNRGEISNVQLKALNQNLSPKVANYFIGWNYKTNFSRNIKEFKVYVRYPNTGDPNYYLVKTIKAPASTNAANAQGGGSQYGVVNPLTKGDAALKGEGYLFKIVAHHLDGGYAIYEGSVSEKGSSKN